MSTTPISGLQDVLRALGKGLLTWHRVITDADLIRDSRAEMALEAKVS